jgi:myo-inositol-1(or 4)-monophosphatase
MTAEEIRRELRAVADLAEEAGRLSLQWFRTPLAVANKAGGGRFDPVTAADHAVEEFLRGELSRRFPDHRIVGEEAGESGGAGPWRWIIDPIDGTRAFVSGNPLWGMLVGLDDGERAVGGVVHVPYLRETFIGDGTEAWLRRDGREISIRSRAGTLDEAILYCTHPESLTAPEDKAAFRRLAERCRMVRYGGDCYSYCLLAMGHVDLVAEGSLQPYDVVALVPIVSGAGGVMTGARGGRAEEGGFILAAANPALHAQAFAVLNDG